MSLSIRFRIEPVRTLNFSVINGTYMGVGTSLTNPARQIYIQNLTDVILMFSLNGIDDHFPLPANGYFLNDITTNKTNTQGFYLAEGERLYVKALSVNPTFGDVYFSVMYGSEEI